MVKCPQCGQDKKAEGDIECIKSYDCCIECYYEMIREQGNPGT